MKKTVLRYGLLSTLTLVGISLYTWLTLGPKSDYAVYEVIGYASMVLAMVFVFFGIRHYRNKVNNGVLSFGRGLKVGVLIVLVPTLIFGVFDALYTTVINPGFMDSYYENQLSKAKQTLSPADYELQVAEAKAEREMFGNPVVLFLVMSLTVFMIGMIATVISTLILKRARV
jgi:hypothetical protein